ncbi:MAG: ketoacyl-ACP synthase III [Planctomycetes bacterium]|nr:ketoacyl-ACP synthase III [Planctomycetota bacterium]
MKYTRVFLDAFAYELAPIVVTSAALEDRLAPLYRALHLSAGQLEALTGVRERRWWAPGARLAAGAARAAHKALTTAHVRAAELGAVIYAGVCRENFEPATSCALASELGAAAGAAVYDISNACLGVMNGILDLANRIELGQIRAGLVATCESARGINEIALARMLQSGDMAGFKASLATLTGGSGAAAVVVTDGSFGAPAHAQGTAEAPRLLIPGEATGGGAVRARRRLLGGVYRAAPEHHGLCRWGVDAPAPGRAERTEVMETDAVSVLRHGVALGKATWGALLEEFDWSVEHVDKVICHQIGSANRDMMLAAIGLSPEKDFSTFEFLGNMGTASLPVTTAMAEEREFLAAGERVALLGIGSGLNCLMLGVEW